MFFLTPFLKGNTEEKCSLNLRTSPHEGNIGKLAILKWDMSPSFPPSS